MENLITIHHLYHIGKISFIFNFVHWSIGVTSNISFYGCACGCIVYGCEFFYQKNNFKTRSNTKVFFESKLKIIDSNDISSFILSKYQLFFMLHLIKFSFFYHCSIHSYGICITFVFWLFGIILFFYVKHFFLILHHQPWLTYLSHLFFVLNTNGT